MVTYNLAARLLTVINAGGVPITDVSIGSDTDRTTWRVYPASQQSAAQPIIDAFDLNDPANDSAELTVRVTELLDQERIFSALVWAIIDTYSAPATVTKFNAARTKIINSYKAQPWKA